ncbi:MAG TPA: class I SAM-dependent methyltransferase, partial [Dehalococcoidia bacterium]|nr:class I SAM-dependent methyltransferase [Dehalococcoidia bacterium]
MRQEEDAAAYAALRSFAAETLGMGASEGLYRTVSDLLHRSLAGSQPTWLLDLGCGPGRTLVDAATAFPRARVVGLDGSVGALSVAYAVSRLRGPAVEADLRRWGFGTRTIEGRALRNVFLLQADAERLPFRVGR